MKKAIIIGATSGIGKGLAKLLGAEVTCVCSSKNIEFIKSLGADKTLDYTKEESISKLVVYDLILDSVGKRKTSQLKKACKISLAKNGKYVSIDDSPLLCSSERLNRIKKLVEAKNITLIIDRVYPFEQIIEAHKYVELGHKKGNVVITV